MKKNLLLIALFIFSYAVAQEKKIDFTKELYYETNNKEKALSIPTFTVLASANNEFLTRATVNMFPMNFYSDNLGMSAVNIGLNSKLKNSPYAMFYFGFAGNFRAEKQTSEVKVDKIKGKETINGITCNNYLLTFNRYSHEMGYDDDAKEEIKVCVDEKNAINNVSLVSNFINQVNEVKLQNIPLKGLVLKVGPNKEDENQQVILRSIKNTKEFAYFDHRKAMTEQQKVLDSVALAEDKRMKEYEAMDTVAVAAVDSAASYADGYYPDADYEIEKYVSSYKNNRSEDASYAIDNIPSEKLWNGLPKHCRNIEKDFPALDNKDFRDHLFNYVAQMCDMYLTQSYSHNVGIKITLDEIRHEVLYINDNKEKLNKSDKKKVDQYLKNLD